MTILITNGYTLGDNKPVPDWHSRILYDQIARRDDAVITVSSNDDTEGYKEAPISDQTWEWWRATSLPATWAVDAGTAVEVDSVGIAAHDIRTQGAQVEVQYSTDNSTWNTVSGTELVPADDGPILYLFESIKARYWRIRLSASGSNPAPPRIGVCYIGKALAMLRPIKWSGHTPSRFNVDLKKRASTSERGQRLGTTLIREGFTANYEVDNLPELWVRNHLEPFAQSAWRYGYFVAWRPVDFPEEVAFAWSDSPIVPSNQGPGEIPRRGATEQKGRRMSVSWSARIHGGHVSGIRPWGVV